MTAVSNIAVIPPSYTVAATSSNITPDAVSAPVSNVADTSTPTTTSASTSTDSSSTSNLSTPDTTQSSAYDALANANSSTIRGTNLSIQA